MKTNNPRSPLLGRMARIIFRILEWLALAGAGCWSTMAVYYSNLPTNWLRAVAAGVFAVSLIVIILRVRPWWLARLVYLGAFGVVLAWFLVTPPSNERDWQSDVVVLPYAEINGNKITLHNIRNCNYRTEFNFDVQHYDKTFDLEKLRTTDLFMVYWGSPHIAHTMVSFGFDGGDFVCFSIETRKEKGEGYSAVKGLFRQFELTCVIADERDLVRLRTNYRQSEETYLYRLQTSPERSREFFLDYLRFANNLRDHPRWYNAVTENCTTGIRTLRSSANKSPWDWRILFNGHSDTLLYEHGIISTNLALAELKQRCHINVKAWPADQVVDFSQRIRQDVPGIQE